ncbi:nucleoside-diphosphate-sugar epimerase [Anaerosolibacter carboniphilus]|uniref:Nucleoside-diphosphate-sugar epimerase n=1 Tax=Anaerosolibacter carboniphilus TaxID=1417629 RepID=A0A841KLN6_9FIRM|nr:NAD-dependent epimerase/dehydratase family protein [Anaerosolibacter carboniphilus]MBB6214313.1 nucleoside-diphosphate-sugar epimerase [Anaerosolibacter carboniphilus]
MKVLITGGTGFLGKRLALRLCKLDYEVTVIGRNEAAGAELEKNDIRFVSCDLRDEQKLISVCEGKDYVFHCGALSSPWGRYKDFYNINVGGTKNVIEGCKKHSVRRLIHVSTPSIYFDMTDRRNISESDKLPEKPVNDYAKTKLQAEYEIDKAHEEGLAVITIRPRALFGPGDTSIIPRLIRANDKFGVPLIDGGRAFVDVTYIENVVDALLLCKDSDSNTLGKKYNITNGEPMYFADILKLVFDKLGYPFHPKVLSFKQAYRISGAMELIYRTVLLGKEPVLTRYTVGVLSKSQTLNIDAAKKDLGYRPRISIVEGVDEFAKWWSEISSDK